MVWQWSPRQGGQAPTSSVENDFSTKGWPNYHAAYLAHRFNGQNPDAAFDDRYNVGEVMGTEISSLPERIAYAMNTTQSKEFKAEADQCLKEEFIKWLEGTHETNYEMPVYQNKPGQPRRRAISSTVENAGVVAPGQTLNEWRPTRWGQKQLTHLDGVAEFLRDQKQKSEQAEFEMNVLAEYGPQNIDQAWKYFKHWVKGRPIRPEVCMADGLDLDEKDRPRGWDDSVPIPHPEIADYKLKLSGAGSDGAGSDRAGSDRAGSNWGGSAASASETSARGVGSMSMSGSSSSASASTQSTQYASETPPPPRTPTQPGIMTWLMQEEERVTNDEEQETDTGPSLAEGVGQAVGRTTRFALGTARRTAFEILSGMARGLLTPRARTVPYDTDSSGGDIEQAIGSRGNPIEIEDDIEQAIGSRGNPIEIEDDNPNPNPNRRNRPRSNRLLDQLGIGTAGNPQDLDGEHRLRSGNSWGT